VAAALPAAQPQPLALVSAAIPADLAVWERAQGLERIVIAVLYPDRRLDYFCRCTLDGPLDEACKTSCRGVSFRRTHTHVRDASAFASGYGWRSRSSISRPIYRPWHRRRTIHVRLSARVGRAGDRRILGSFDRKRHAAGNGQSLDGPSSMRTSSNRCGAR